MRCMRCGSTVDEDSDRCPACGEVLVLVMVAPEESSAESAPSPKRRYPLRALSLVAALAVAWGALWLVRGPEPNPIASPTPSPSASAAPAAPLGKAPLQVGTTFLCPLDARYAAYVGLGRHYFPPNHPRLPATSVAPDRCFASPSKAEAAGFTLALPPQFSQVVDGVYVVPVDVGRMESLCDRAARRVGFAVPCPFLLPNPGPGVGSPGCGQTLWPAPHCVFRGAFLLAQAGFAVPPGDDRSRLGGPPTELMIVAYRGKPLAPNEEQVDELGVEDVRAFVGCPDARLVETVTNSQLGPARAILLPGTASQADILQCPEEYYPPLRGHLMIRWREAGVTYQVSLFGDSDTNRKLLEVIVANVQLIGPPAQAAP